MSKNGVGQDSMDENGELKKLHGVYYQVMVKCGAIFAPFHNLELAPVKLEHEVNETDWVEQRHY